MTLLVVLLFVLLAVAGTVLFRRERFWRSRLSEIQGALSKKTGDVTQGLPRPASIEGVLQRAEQVASDAAQLGREEYLRRLFEALLGEIRQGVAIVDDQLRVKFANGVLGEILQVQVVRRSRSLIEELRNHEVVETVRSALEKGRRCEKTIRLLATAASGAIVERHCLIEAAPLPASAERGAWLMVHDITEQVMTEQIRKDFVANASHELRTPLTLINGYIETLQSGVITDPASTRRCLDVMEKHGRRIMRLVEDMLTISRLEGASSTLHREPFNVKRCVETVIENLAPMVAERRARIVLDFPSDGGMMNGDRFYWDQVFMNLIENALKENTRGGLEIRVSGTWHKDDCLLKVADNGVGIPAHDVPFVFKRFYRGQKAHGSDIKGTGLGLSIVKRAVEAHGGSIELESTPGVATVFMMCVPLGVAEEPFPEQPASPAAGRVVVDPEPAGAAA